MATYEIEIKTTVQTLDVGPPGSPYDSEQLRGL